jgi:hypothetical protein
MSDHSAAAIVSIYEVQNDIKIFMYDKITKPRSSLVTSVQTTHPNYTLANNSSYKRNHAGISYRSVDRYIEVVTQLASLSVKHSVEVLPQSYVNTICKHGVKRTQKLHQ